jgi:hypothetical protein
MIKDLFRRPLRRRNTGIWLKFCETWLLKRGSAEHATNSLIVLTILIGWLPSSNSHLKLPLEGFAPVSKGSV